MSANVDDMCWYRPMVGYLASTQRMPVQIGLPAPKIMMKIYDKPHTLYVSGRGWVTYWTEVGSINGAILKRGIERPATSDEVFVAQMNYADQR